jgi:hypothetical protein
MGKEAKEAEAVSFISRGFYIVIRICHPNTSSEHGRHGFARCRCAIDRIISHLHREELMRPWLFAVVLALCSSSVAVAQLAAGNASTLTDDKIISGLKEALEVSTTKAVALTGRHDGFLKNESIRILLPPKLQSIGKSMRLIGMGDQVDELEIGINRAAEQATPQAKEIFLTALKKMTFHDARRILAGNETAATDYFRAVSSADLTAAFTPVVHHSLEHVGVIRQYNHVIKSAPGGAALASEFDLDQYVVEQTLNGVFEVLGAEESMIRRDPAAQTSALLKEVFGGS